MPSWPNLEAMAVVYLRAATGRRVSTRVPADLTGAVPFVRVTRGPGGDDESTDSPLLDVETFTARQGSVIDRWDFAEECRQALHAMAGKAVAGALVDRVVTTSSPAYVDYGNSDVDRLVATYRVEFRKQF